MSLASSAMLSTLSVTLWTARKTDKIVSAQIDEANKTLARAGNYHKRLLPEDDNLLKIKHIADEARAYHNQYTSPWSDGGQRLLTTAYFLPYKKAMTSYQNRFYEAVDEFIPQYTVKVSGAAFSLGFLFNRDEYPSEEQVRSKFSFSVFFTPVPQAGDFRVDVQNEALDELKRQYDEMYTHNVRKINQDLWNRMYTTLSQLSNGLKIDEDGKKGRLYESVFETAEELCDILQHLNISNDTQLEEMRQQLEAQIVGVDLRDVKQSDFMRLQMKKQVDAMLDKWND